MIWHCSCCCAIHIVLIFSNKTMSVLLVLLPVDIGIVVDSVNVTVIVFAFITFCQYGYDYDDDCCHCCSGHLYCIVTARAILLVVLLWLKPFILHREMPDSWAAPRFMNQLTDTPEASERSSGQSLALRGQAERPA